MKTTSEVFFIWCKLGVKFKVRCRVFELFDDIIALFARSAALYTFFDHIPKKCFSISRIQVLSCAYKTRILEQEDFGDLYLPEWSNALCNDRKHLDVLGVGAYDGNILVGLAACSADCKDMWQIGVDVLPKYRRQGIASVLTSTLTKEIINRDKVPFYCTAWSNIRSVRNAIKSGFVPAWVEMTAKPTNIVDEMNL